MVRRNFPILGIPHPTKGTSALLETSFPVCSGSSVEDIIKEGHPHKVGLIRSLPIPFLFPPSTAPMHMSSGCSWQPWCSVPESDRKGASIATISRPSSSPFGAPVKSTKQSPLQVTDWQLLRVSQRIQRFLWRPVGTPKSDMPCWDQGPGNNVTTSMFIQNESFSLSHFRQVLHECSISFHGWESEACRGKFICSQLLGEPEFEPRPPGSEPRLSATKLHTPHNPFQCEPMREAHPSASSGGGPTPDSRVSFPSHLDDLT